MDNFCRCLCLLGKEIGFMERALQLFSKQKYIFAVQSPIVSKTKLGDIAQGWALVEVSMFKKDVFILPWGWDEYEILSPKPQTYRFLAPMLYHWAAETLWWTRPIISLSN